MVLRSMFQKSVNREYKSYQLKNLNQSFEAWLLTLGYKPYTVKVSKNNMAEYFAFLENQGITKLKEINPEHTFAYLDYLEHRPNCNKGGSLKAGSINKQVTTLRMFGKFLQLSGKAETNINPKHLKTQGSATSLSKEEMKILYETAARETNNYNKRDTAMLSIYYGCGLRGGEGAALNASDILFERNLVYIRNGKGYRERYVPMSKRVKAHLKDYILNQRSYLLNGKENEALLLSRRGERWSVAGMYVRLKLLKEKSENKELKTKSFGLHILRHSIATHLLQGGMQLEDIGKFLGHKSIETTQKYTHLSTIALAEVDNNNDNNENQTNHQ
jgi:integrase/recombinase XerD